MNPEATPNTKSTPTCSSSSSRPRPQQHHQATLWTKFRRHRRSHDHHNTNANCPRYSEKCHYHLQLADRSRPAAMIHAVSFCGLAACNYCSIPPVNKMKLQKKIDKTINSLQPICTAFHPLVRQVQQIISRMLLLVLILSTPSKCKYFTTLAAPCSTIYPLEPVWLLVSLTTPK
mmetsp:Transcript_22051/g.28541  ORF Transcript_22051/g.28541 Transcript_22051/m.28541 type:complete len:174 (-) Transcript_22051:74-595(-)